MKTEMIVLFLLAFYFVSANQVVSVERKKVSCRDIQTKGGYFYKIDPCTEGTIIIEQNKYVIGVAKFSSGKEPNIFVIHPGIFMDGRGIVTKYCENTSAEFHGCNKISGARIEYYPTNDTSNNGVPGASSKPNVTHPIANDTLKNVVLSIGMVGVLVAMVFAMEPWKKGKPDNHEGNNIEMEPLQVVVEPDQAAYA
ncbi:uncharacterized protein ACBT44_021122 isoform 2-T2 [Syngnathus typhle]